MSIRLLSCLLSIALACEDPAVEPPGDTGVSDAEVSDAGRGEADAGEPIDRVYVIANATIAGGNAIVGLSSSSLGFAPLPGSPFATGGAGGGVQAADQQLVVTADGERMVAVNAGDDSLSVFDIADTGSLVSVPGSPFPALGPSPASVGIAGTTLVVAHQAGGFADTGTTSPAPGYATFTMLQDGSLEAVPGSVVPARRRSSPTQALMDSARGLVFGAHEFDPTLDPSMPSLRTFRLVDRRLVEVPGPPVDLPPALAASPVLGLALHPTAPILYASFPMLGTVGIFEYDADGASTYVGTASNTGRLVCWLVVSAAGDRMYSGNTADGSVSAYDLSDPRAPIEVQHYRLNTQVPGRLSLPSTYNLALSRDGARLYVLDLWGDAIRTGGTILHRLEVGSDGLLRETAQTGIGPDLAVGLVVL